MPSDPLGAIVSLASGFFNKKKAPATVPYTPVDLATEQKKTLAGNLAAQPDIETLLSKANAFTQGQATDLMEKAVPGYAAFAKNLLQTGADKLANPYDLPAGVTENLNRISAERGISRGTAGQTNEYSALRDLGVNMLDYGNQNFQQALQALTTVTNLSPRISPLSPMSFYVTPAQQASVTQDNNVRRQAIEQGGANARTDARNWNTQNLWDSIARSAGMINVGTGSGIGSGIGSAAGGTG